MASTILSEISVQGLSDSSISPSASITGVKHLSSYNWIEARTPTIAVPGSPPLWSAPNGSVRVKKDTGFIYIAQNAARHPESPLEPLFRALYIADPEFDIRSIDVVTDRNNVRKLLSFIDPSSAKNGLEAFTIHVEVVENTAILSREETATSETIGPSEFKGFGHEFEKAYTTSQIGGSTGHHRIISYRLGDLKFVIRHETDGYVGKEGQVVPIEATLEIKTRVLGKRLEISEVASQLWISQTPNLVRAFHNNGTFLDPKVEDVAAQIKAWENRNQANLTKVAALIRKIIAVVRNNGRNAIVRYDVNKRKLVVTKFDGKKMLPKDLYYKWSCGNKAEAESVTDQEVDLKGV
ncbi:hypothetical protein G7Y79_00078g099860 [Physcia stellaris]|nr:hypothetical protein G7Y79_00078g099860 [Physcia stellaris]